MLIMVATLAMVDMTVMVWDMVELQLVSMVLIVTQIGMANICMENGFMVLLVLHLFYLFIS